jgi:diadenosine tetraphosphatase ApaH/serine/threonine PP2A family protein phosphatase
MRVAAIYDIHANLPALEVVLEDIRKAEADLLIVGGDVLPGPMPREALGCLRDLHIPVRCIYGNGEIAVLEQMAGKEPNAVPPAYRPIIRWTAEQLDSGHQQLLSSWPKTLRLGISGLGDVLFCHATPRSEREIFTRSTPETRLLPIFDNVGVQLVVCGHTHMQFDRPVGKTRVVNAGSVGMPFGKPGADWLLLGPHIQFRHTAYDLGKAAERIRRTDYPQAQDFAARNVLQPPSEADMLAAFARVELA